MFRIHHPEHHENPSHSLNGREIGGREIKARWTFGENLAIDLGGSSGFLPIRIATKACPVLFGLISSTEVGNDVDQRIGFTLVGIRWRPVGDIFHAIFFKNLASMVAKTRVQILQPIWGGGVGAQLEHTNFFGYDGFHGR